MGNCKCPVNSVERLAFLARDQFCARGSKPVELMVGRSGGDRLSALVPEYGKNLIGNPTIATCRARVRVLRLLWDRLPAEVSECRHGFVVASLPARTVERGWTP